MGDRVRCFFFSARGCLPSRSFSPFGATKQHATWMVFRSPSRPGGGGGAFWRVKYVPPGARVGCCRAGGRVACLAPADGRLRWGPGGWCPGERSKRVELSEPGRVGAARPGRAGSHHTIGASSSANHLARRREGQDSGRGLSARATVSGSGPSPSVKFRFHNTEAWRQRATPHSSLFRGVTLRYHGAEPREDSSALHGTAAGQDALSACLSRLLRCGDSDHRIVADVIGFPFPYI